MSRAPDDERSIPRRVTRGDVDLAVFERGAPDAETIVLVHGYPDSHVVWDRVAAVLARRFHVVAYDVRGAGDSSAPRSRDGYRIEELAADLRAVIDATSAGRPAHVVAHDWGSIQSWEAVTDERISPRIASYTSISGPCLDHVALWLREGVSSGSYGRVAAQLVRSWYVAFFQIPGAAERLWRAGLARAWPGMLRRTEGVTDPAPVRPDDGVRGLELYRANVPRRLRAPRDRTTRVPVQILIPLGDRFVTPPLARAAERFAPRLTIHEIEGGHWVLRDAPDTIAEHVIAHVDAAARLAP
ncbi:MAG: alpha/beta fold hydrolase [Polyangiaceae bacterium]